MKTYRRDLAVKCATVLALAAPLTCLAGHHSGYARVFPPDAKPYGKTYSQWTARWWQWALSRPLAGHPFLNDGFRCNSANNGQSGPVWFLASSAIPPEGLPPNPALPPHLSALVERTCEIPAGTSILLGLENVEGSTLEGYRTEAQQRAYARFNADHVVKSSLICVIDGRMVADLDDFRFASPQFTFHAPTPWIYDPLPGGTGKAVADGYYVMIKPLAKGHHTLSCGGRFHFSAEDLPPSGADFGFGNTYHLYVQDREKHGRPGDLVGPKAGDAAGRRTGDPGE